MVREAFKIEKIKSVKFVFVKTQSVKNFTLFIFSILKASLSNEYVYRLTILIIYVIFVI